MEHQSFPTGEVVAVEKGHEARRGNVERVFGGRVVCPDSGRQQEKGRHSQREPRKESLLNSVVHRDVLRRKKARSLSNSLCENLMNRFGLSHPGEPLIQTVVEKRQLAMVETHRMQNGRVQIADVAAVDGRLVADLVGFAVADSRLDSAACHPIREALWVVVAAERLL